MYPEPSSQNVSDDSDMHAGTFSVCHDDDPDQHHVCEGPMSTVTETKLFSASHEHVGAANHDTEAASAYALGPTHCMDAGNIVGGGGGVRRAIVVAAGGDDEWRFARRCE